jgi:hypothetical protein
MPFRTLSSIEFQGSCSRDLNMVQSDNCIFGIYDQYSFCRCLTRTSLDLSGEVKSSFFQMSNRKKTWKLILCCFDPYVLLKFKAPVAKTWIYTPVWKLYFWNLRSTGFLSVPNSCITRQSVLIKSKFFQLCNRKNVKVIIMPFRTLSSIEFQGPVAETWIWASLRIVSLESITNTLSVDGLLVHH